MSFGGRRKHALATKYEGLIAVQQQTPLFRNANACNAQSSLVIGPTKPSCKSTTMTEMPQPLISVLPPVRVRISRHREYQSSSVALK